MPKSKRASRRQAHDEEIATTSNNTRHTHPIATAGKQPSTSSLSPAAANASTNAMQKAVEVNPPTAPTTAALMRQQFLPNPGEPALKWPIWFNMFEDHLIATGMENIPDKRKVAILRSSLGTEGYRICAELCSLDATYNDTVEKLQQRFSPKQSTICARAQFNRRIQSSYENSLEYVTALRTLAAKCNYHDAIRDELIRDRFVVGCATERLRERLLLESDELTLEQAQTIAQTYERATSECTSIATTSPSDSIQAIGTRTSYNNERGRSFSRNSTERFHRSPKREYSPRQYNSPPARESPSRYYSPSSNLSSFRRRKTFRDSECFHCGGNFSPTHHCPARGQTCKACGKIGHFESVCRSTKGADIDSNRPNISLGSTITKQTEDLQKYVRCRIRGRTLNLLIDSGTKISLLNSSCINSLLDSPRLDPSNVMISTYTRIPINVLGTVRLNVNFRSQEITTLPFHVVRSGNNLIGMDLFDALGIRLSTPETASTIATVFTSPRHGDSSVSQFEIHKSIQPTQRSFTVSTGEDRMQWSSTRPRVTSTRYAYSYLH